MHLYLLRHCDALELGFDDYYRPLSSNGKIQAGIVGRYLQLSDIRPDVLMSSPMVRTMETAEIIREELQMESLVKTVALLPGSDLRVLIAELNSRSHKSVLLIGHEPQLRTLFAKITGNRTSFFEFRKGTLVALQCTYPLISEKGSFLWTMPNDQMEKKLIEGREKS